MTPLEKALRRSITIKGKDYVVTLTPSALKITLKGHRNGLELPWEELVSGERALAVALQASVGQFEAETEPRSHAAAKTSTQRNGKAPSAPAQKMKGAARKHLPGGSILKKARRR